MSNRKFITQTALWTARISGTSVLAFVLFMIGAHIFGVQPPSDNEPLTTTELLSVICGIGMLIGLAIALFREGLGGLISTLGIIGFFIVRSDLIANPGLEGWFVIPGLLYLIYWYLHSGKSDKKQYTTQLKNNHNGNDK